jgi:hypothetical protein
VREAVNRIFVRAEDRSGLIEPKLCVALGAALWGYIKDKPGANIDFIGGANLTIHDIGYLAIKGMKQVFVPVFAARTEFPAEKIIEIPGRKDWIDLRLAESRTKSAAEESSYEVIGGVRIDTREIAEQVVPVTFALDENRMLHISVNGIPQTILGREED